MDEWVWWLGGGLGAVAVFFIVSRLFGWKIGALAAGALVLFSGYRGQLRRAEERGRDAERERQREEAQDAILRGNEFEEAERERQRREGSGSPRPNDPHVVDRHTARGLSDYRGGD